MRYRQTPVEDEMTQQSNRRAIIAVTSLLALSATAATSHAAERTRFRGQFQATTRTVIPPPAGRCDDEPDHAAVVGLLEAQGAGDIDILGQIVDEQSQCVRADGTFFGGRFTFTNRKGQSISGRFFGALVPTFNATFPPATAAPAGAWIVEGNVCVSGGNFGRIRNDCRAGRYAPARGLANLNLDGTGDATVFIDQTIDIANGDRE
jgi:hypothetical protein